MLHLPERGRAEKNQSVQVTETNSKIFSYVRYRKQKMSRICGTGMACLASAQFLLLQEHQDLAGVFFFTLCIFHIRNKLK